MTKKGKKGKKGGIGSRPSLKGLKSSVTRICTKARECAQHIEGVIRMPGERLMLEDHAAYRNKILHHLAVLQELPESTDYHIQRDDLMSQTVEMVEMNREEMNRHLTERGWEELVGKLELMLEGPLKEKVPNTSAIGIENREVNLERIDEGAMPAKGNRGSEVSSPQDHKNRISGNSNASESQEHRFRSVSTLASTELAEMLSRQLTSMQQVQELLLEKVDNLQRDRDIHVKDTQQMKREVAELNQLTGQASQLFQEAGRRCKDSTEEVGVQKKTQSESIVHKIRENTSESKDNQELLKKKDEASASECRDKENCSEKSSPVKRENSSRRSMAKSTPMLATNIVSSIMSSIKPFNGEGENYMLFRQTFDILVHKNEEIPTPLKQTLLMRLLEEDVLNMMKTPAISEEDYRVLLENLDRQYAREEDSTQHYIDLLDKHTFSTLDYDAMEKELNRFCTIVNILKNRGSNPDDPVFMSKFVKRLPPQVMGPVYKKMLKGNRKFQDLVLIAYEVIREKKIIESAHENKKKRIQAEDVLAVKVNMAGAVQHSEQSSSEGSSQDQMKESFFRAMEAETFDSDSD